MIDTNKNKRIAVTLSLKIYDLLKDEAEYEDRSVSKMAAVIIKKYYRNKLKNKMEKEKE